MLNKIQEVTSKEVTLDFSTYTVVSKRARFVHERFGEWWARPIMVLKGRSNHRKAGNEKREKTNIQRYGVPFAMQNRELALKSARKSRFVTILKHWKTNEEIVCSASYEPAAVNYLNNNKIEYLWQPKSFKIPSDILKTEKEMKQSTYSPDIYLINENKWIEIKGAWRGRLINGTPISKIKWLWFHKEYPNSELWNYDYLKNKGIL